MPVTEHPAKQFFNQHVGRIDNLAARWDDEQEFEDINDYKDAIQTHATPFGLTVTAMTKRPFGCTLQSSDKKNFRIVVTTKQIKFEEVK